MATTSMTSPWRPAIGVIGAALVLLIFCALIRLCTKPNGRKNGVHELSAMGNKETSYLSAHELDTLQNSKRDSKAWNTDRPDPHQAKLKPKRPSAPTAIIVLFTTLYLAYAVMFTMSVVFSIIYITLQPGLSFMSNITALKTSLNNNFTGYVNNMSVYSSDEIQRLYRIGADRHRACGEHLERELARVNSEIHANSLIQLRIWRDSATILKHSLSELILQQANEYNTSLEKFMDEFNTTLSTKLQAVMIKYMEYSQAVSRNPWLKFPRTLFRAYVKDARLHKQVMDRDVAYLDWLKVDKVADVINAKKRITQRALEFLPHLSTDNFNHPQTNTNPEEEIKLEAVLSNQMLKFLTMPTTVTPATTDSTSPKPPEGHHEPPTPPDLDILSLTRLPMVIICFCLVCDLCLFIYRMTWLCKTVRYFTNGFVRSHPTDDVTNMLHTLQHGKSMIRSHDPREHPYAYYKENKDDPWSSNDMYFFPANVGKSKEDILREIWNHKHQHRPLQPKKDGCCQSAWSYLCSIIVHSVVWKFLISLLFGWIVCVLIHVIDSYITMDTCKYVLSANLLIPQLEVHLNMTNTVIDDYANHVNSYVSQFDNQIDAEVDDINAVLEMLISNQGRLWHTLISQACRVVQNATQHTSCDLKVPAPSLTSTIVPCNFLSVYAQPYIGLQSGLFGDLVNTELSPLVASFRHNSFSMAYILLAFLCLLFLLHLATNVLFSYLLHRGVLPRRYLFHTALTGAEWAGNADGSKGLYASGSWAQSESGVYGCESEESANHNTLQKESHV